MFSFLRKDPSKKSNPEKESDGFVILGETADEQKQKQKNETASSVKPAAYVIVQGSKTQSTAPAAPVQPAPVQPAPVQPAPTLLQPPANQEGAPSYPELLGDVPFTLAPHVLAMQTGLFHLPDVLLSRDINDNLAGFRYDFTLENSVLCDS